MLSVILVVLSIGASIAAHEWSHLRSAQRNHMRVEEYSIGFGRRIFSRVAPSGIRYSLRLIPLGGSVRIAGMAHAEPGSDAAPRVGSSAGIGFMEASPWVRLRVIAAGVGMNLVLTLIAFTLLAAIFIGTPSAGNLIQAPVTAVLATGAIIGMMLVGLLGTFSGGGLGSILAVPSALSSSDTAQMVDAISPAGYGLMMFGLLNLALAFGNALPLHPLDGYHFIVAAIDAVRRARAKRRGAEWSPLTADQQKWPARLSGAALVSLMVFVVGQDFLRFLG